jgi:hypothetical protein
MDSYVAVPVAVILRVITHVRIVVDIVDRLMIERISVQQQTKCAV